MQLNFRVEGKGPPLLLVHGFGISFNIWRDLLPRLCPHFTVVMIELPGIGQSPREIDDRSYLATSIAAIECLRSKLGFDSWNVLGYSTGSRIVEAYTRIHASRVRGLIFLCPLVLPFLTNYNLRLSLWIDRVFPVYGDFVLTGWRLKSLIRYFAFSLKPCSMVDEWYAEMSGNSRPILKETLRMVAPVGTRRLTAPKPASYIWGRDDFVTIQPRKPGASDFFVHASHAAPMVATEEVSALIIKILRNS